MTRPSGTGEASFPKLEWTPCAGADPAPSVMLVIDHRAPSRSATLRAARLASSFGARLKIVDIVQRQPHHPPGLTTIASASSVLGHAPCDVEVLYGELRSAVVGRAHDHGPSLIVAGARTSLALACDLVDELHLPVILARESRPGGRFLAASDIQLGTFPVLRTARELAQRCACDLTLFHNEATEAAILELVRDRDIDLVIVGQGVTERLLARCPCSVMIVPIAAAA